MILDLFVAGACFMEMVEFLLALHPCREARLAHQLRRDRNLRTPASSAGTYLRQPQEGQRIIPPCIEICTAPLHYVRVPYMRRRSRTGTIATVLDWQ